MSENGGIICSCAVVVGGVSSTSDEGFSQVMCKEHWFEREVERRAGATEEEMRAIIEQVESGKYLATMAPHLADWVRRILGEREPHQSGEQCRQGTCAICDEHRRERS